MKTRIGLLFILLGSAGVLAQTPPGNTATVDEQGLTHITRVVPVPRTASPEAQDKLIHPPPSILSSKATVEEQREKIDARQARDAAAWQATYPVIVVDAVIAGVPVRIVTPAQAEPKNAGRVLINLHGGGFTTDTGSLLESIPIASLTRTKVVSVLYRLAPEHPFPDALEDAVAVYAELLKTYRPDHIGLYGTSAGAILTAETAARLRRSGQPLPAALGIFSALGDFSIAGDSMALFGLQGLLGRVPMPSSGPLLPYYVGKTDPKDPTLSPLYSDLSGFPPTLFMTSTRDMLLSGTVVLYQAFLKAGVDSRLSVFEALPHAFWLDAGLPESKTACEQMAKFLDEHVGR